MTAHRLSTGDYLVFDVDGRRIGIVKREQKPTAKVGRMQFVAYAGHHRRRDTFLAIHDTLRSAVEHVTNRQTSEAD